jgi:ABC-type multidrug transport system fused ATPase/permease subunit
MGIALEILNRGAVMSISFFLQLIVMILIPLAAVIIPVLIGRRYGFYHITKQMDIPKDSIGSVVAAALGLLAFMLAFTFQIATNRWDSRRALLYEEVQGIRTAYLRAGLIPEPYRSNTKKNLVDYIDLRVDVANDQSKVADALSGSQLILDSLWGYTEALAAVDRSSEVYALYTSSINDIVDAYNKRITVALVYRIPVAVLWFLFIIMFLSMLILGYQFGVSGKGSLVLNLLLALVFSVVMFLIFALDRPEIGLIKLRQAPLLTLQQELHAKQLNVPMAVP